MAFRTRVLDFVAAALGSHEPALRLPLRKTSAMRAKRMPPENRALDYNLMVRDCCVAIRQALAEDNWETLAKSVTELLHLLDEDKEQK